jgi:hypothetical protein
MRLLAGNGRAPARNPPGLPSEQARAWPLRHESHRCSNRVWISIPVATAKKIAAWSAGGQLDWWVKERREWWGACAVQMAVSAGSEPLIYVQPAAHSYNNL